MSLKRSVRTIIGRMIVTLQTERLQTVEQIRGFLDGNGEVGFTPLDRDEAYGFARRTLVRLDYDALGRAGKGTVREFLGKATGLSRAQVTRLIGQYRATGRVEDRRAANSGRSFERVYTAADIRLLAEADEIGGQLCGPAACEVLRRQYEVFGDARFERLSRLSPSHLYNLRRSKTYRARRTTVDHTRPTTVRIGERRRPGPRRQARLRACGHGPPGRSERREGRLRHQPDRRSHPVRACRRRGRDRRDVPRPGAAGDARHAAVRGRRVPCRQRFPSTSTARSPRCSTSRTCRTSGSPGRGAPTTTPWSRARTPADARLPARAHRAVAVAGHEAGGRGAGGGHVDGPGQQVVAALRTAGSRRVGGSFRARAQGGHRAGSRRTGDRQGRQSGAGHAPAQHADDGGRGRHLGLQCESHLARSRTQAASQAHLQAVQRSPVRGEVLGRRGAVSRSAREVHRPVLRREDADSGAAAHATRSAARQRSHPHRDPRLPSARHDHAVCGDELPRRQTHRPTGGQAHARRVAPVPQADRQADTGRRGAARHRRQLRHAQNTPRSRRGSPSIRGSRCTSPRHRVPGSTLSNGSSRPVPRVARAAWPMRRSGAHPRTRAPAPDVRRTGEVAILQGGIAS